MNGDKVEVIVRKTQDEIQGQHTAQGMPATSEPGRQSIQAGAVNTAMIKVGKSIVSQGIREYIDYTGQYRLGNMIDSMSEIAGYAGTIAVGGPVGAVYVGFEIASKIASVFINQSKVSQEIQFMNQRLGYIAQAGSRYSNE